jgi:predicted nucleic acid-binding protein
VNVLVDTSVWSLALRRRASNLSPTEKETVTELAELIHEGRAKLIGLVRQELLSGIKSHEQFAKLREHLRSFPDEPVDLVDHETAAQLANQCRNKGISVSSCDMLICAVAQSRGWSIFSTDPDFARYGTVLRCQLHSIRK